MIKKSLILCLFMSFSTLASTGKFSVYPLVSKKASPIEPKNMDHKHLFLFPLEQGEEVILQSSASQRSKEEFNSLPSYLKQYILTSVAYFRKGNEEKALLAFDNFLDAASGNFFPINLTELIYYISRGVYLDGNLNLLFFIENLHRLKEQRSSLRSYLQELRGYKLACTQGLATDCSSETLMRIDANINQLFSEQRLLNQNLSGEYRIFPEILSKYQALVDDHVRLIKKLHATSKNFL